MDRIVMWVFAALGVVSTVVLLAILSLVAIWQGTFGPHTAEVVFVAWAALAVFIGLASILLFSVRPSKT